jgi:hypothetical protein
LLEANMVDPFRQAEAQYERLMNEVVAGSINLEQFHQQLNQIRVTDAQGRTWMLQEGSGQWFVWHNGQWMQAQPYAGAPTAPPTHPLSAGAYVDGNYGAANYGAANYGASSGAPAYAQPAQPAYRQALPPLEGGWGKVLGSMLKAAIAALVIFGLIGGALVVFDQIPAADMPKVMLAPTALSLVISFFSVSSQWRGRIVQFVTKRERDGSDDEAVTYHNVTYARLQLENGRTKDVRPPRDWQVGDVIEKRRGEWGPRKL